MHNAAVPKQHSSRSACGVALQVKWKDLVSDLNLVPTSMDYERTGTIDLGLGTLPLPFAKFKKGTAVERLH